MMVHLLKQRNHRASVSSARKKKRKKYSERQRAFWLRWSISANEPLGTLAKKSIRI
jgi:hypothetical protein